MSVLAPPELKSRIRRYWADAPMTYGDTHGETRYTRPDGSTEIVQIGSHRFYELADERFYGWNKPLERDGAPFARIFDYAAYAGKPILEVGCGMGCMAMNWARRGAAVHAVDLNPVSVAQTRRRFELFDLQGDIREADAEHLPFADGAFDYAYSWGVLHHTPGTREAIGELHRVLRPGGRFGLMLYHRHSFLDRFTIRWQEGVVNMEGRFLSPLRLASRYSDGAREEGNPHTWPVTKREVREELTAQFANVAIRVLGTDVDPILGGWLPGMERWLPRAMKKSLARRWGWSLWITGEKPR